jgi:hypothetical protein
MIIINKALATSSPITEKQAKEIKQTIKMNLDAFDAQKNEIEKQRILGTLSGINFTLSVLGLRKIYEEVLDSMI